MTERWMRLGLVSSLAGLVIACVQIIGIDKADEDPSLSQTGVGGSSPEAGNDGGSPPGDVGEECVHFDNAARLEHAGVLLPLPQP